MNGYQPSIRRMLPRLTDTELRNDQKKKHVRLWHGGRATQRPRRIGRTRIGKLGNELLVSYLLHVVATSHSVLLFFLPAGLSPHCYVSNLGCSSLVLHCGGTPYRYCCLVKVGKLPALPGTPSALPSRLVQFYSSSNLQGHLQMCVRSVSICTQRALTRTFFMELEAISILGLYPFVGLLRNKQQQQRRSSRGP